MNKPTIYFDMDGVLADFDKSVKKLCHLDEQPWLTVPGFFKRLEVIGNPNDTIAEIKNLGYPVRILTKVETRDTMRRVKDKEDWIAYHLPAVEEDEIIIVPIEGNKTDFVENIKNSILVDDYKGNLLEWHKLGGIAIKFGRYYKNHRPYLQILNDISNLLPLLQVIENFEKR